MVQQTWQTGPIRNIASGTSILEITIRDTTGVGFHTKSIRKMCSQKNIEGKQCTIIWHVDDLKISHTNKDVVENILKKLNDKFGQESPLTTCRGKVLEYLGMKIDYRQKGR